MAVREGVTVSVAVRVTVLEIVGVLDEDTDIEDEKDTVNEILDVTDTEAENVLVREPV